MTDAWNWRKLSPDDIRVVIGGRMEGWVNFWKTPPKYGAGVHFDTGTLPNVVTSMASISYYTNKAWHLPVLDIDKPRTALLENDLQSASPGKYLIYNPKSIQWVPSTTLGHWHAFIDMPIGWEDYLEFLSRLVDRDVIDSDWAEMSEHQGYATVRIPGVSKFAPEPTPDMSEALAAIKWKPWEEGDKLVVFGPNQHPEGAAHWSWPMRLPYRRITDITNC